MSKHKAEHEAEQRIRLKTKKQASKSARTPRITKTPKNGRVKK